MTFLRPWKMIPSCSRFNGTNDKRSGTRREADGGGRFTFIHLSVSGIELRRLPEIKSKPDSPNCPIGFH